MLNSKFNKFLPTQRELKSLEAQVCGSQLNLSTYMQVARALIEEHGYSRQVLLRCSHAYIYMRTLSKPITAHCIFLNSHEGVYC